MINIVCTSKPCDGLLYYSYEYCAYLNEMGIDSQMIIVCHRNFSRETYVQSIKEKYIHFKNVLFDSYIPRQNEVTMIMGRSMMTLSYQDFNSYTVNQQATLIKLFKNKVIAVYSENHPEKYPKSVEFYSPQQIIDLCDHEVYLNGTGIHFEKTINFSIHQEPESDVQFEYLFLGTNARYYEAVQAVIDDFPDHGIIVYDEFYIDNSLNNINAPVNNLLGTFNTFVYTKNTFDPAPRIIQESKYFDKRSIYLRDKSIHDGGSVYWNRPLKKPNIEPIVQAYEKMQDEK